MKTRKIAQLTFHFIFLAFWGWALEHGGRSFIFRTMSKTTAGHTFAITVRGQPAYGQHPHGAGSWVERRGFNIASVQCATAGAASSNLKLGFNNTNNSTVAEGSTHSLGTSFAPVEDYFATDPTTGSNWGASLAGYQLELRSA